MPIDRPDFTKDGITDKIRHDAQPIRSMMFGCLFGAPFTAILVLASYLVITRFL